VVILTGNTVTLIQIKFIFTFLQKLILLQSHGGTKRLHTSNKSH